MRVLLVEDHAPLGDAVREQLASDGHAVDWMTELGNAEAAARTVAYELVLLDLLLPDGRGLDFLKRLRGGGNAVPVIIMTALDRISDRIAGLNAGADDYLVKPFDLDELSARVGAVARRAANRTAPSLTLGDLSIDLAARTLHRDGRTVNLTAREWALLDCLVRNAGVTLSKSRLEEAGYGFDAEIESNAVEAQVSRLRRKIGRDAIRTVHGLGYRLGDGSVR